MAGKLSHEESALSKYSPWFYAAAVYNLVWGTVNILFPRLLFELFGMSPPYYLPLWQVVGMLVLVYAPAYWWAGDDPDRHRHIIVIAAIGKLFGPIGFLFGAITGQLPLVFGLTILTNDLIWWPAFGLYLSEAARIHGGFGKLLMGR
jgi:hypothetical protein